MTDKNKNEISKNVIDSISNIIHLYISENHDRKIKRNILDSPNIPFDDKLVLYCNYNKIKKHYKRSKDVLVLAEKYFGQGEEIFLEKIQNLEEDWFDFFMEKVEQVSNERVKFIWAELLNAQLNNVDECKPENDISKKLISILCLLSAEDILAFRTICSMTFESLSREFSRYPFIYIVENSKFYEKYDLRRYKLASLAHLGLIEYNGPDSNFVLPKITPKIKYHNIIVEFCDNKRINYGNVRLTTEGRRLYELTGSEYCEYLDDFIENCKIIWDDKKYTYKITVK